MSTSVKRSLILLKVAGFVAMMCVLPIIPFCSIPEFRLPLVPEDLYHILRSLVCNTSTVEYVETVPQTAATILGLANFGFLLGVRLNRPEMRIQYNFLATAFIAICVITALQMALIMHAHGNTLHLPFYYYVMGVTTMALIVAGYSFVRVVKEGSRTEKRDDKHRDDMDEDD